MAGLLVPPLTIVGSSVGPPSGLFPIGQHYVDSQLVEYVNTANGWIIPKPGQSLAVFISASITESAANTPTNICSIAFPPGEWTIQGMAVLFDSSAGWEGTVWIGPTSASQAGAYNIVSATEASNYCILEAQATMTFEAQTVVYLCAESTLYAVTISATGQSGGSNVTGLQGNQV